MRSRPRGNVECRPYIVGLADRRCHSDSACIYPRSQYEAPLAGEPQLQSRAPRRMKSAALHADGMLQRRVCLPHRSAHAVNTRRSSIPDRDSSLRFLWDDEAADVGTILRQPISAWRESLVAICRPGFCSTAKGNWWIQHNQGNRQVSFHFSMRDNRLASTAETRGRLKRDPGQSAG